MPLYVDRPTHELVRALTSDVVRQGHRLAKQELQPLLDEAIRRHSAGSGTCDAILAGHVLRTCIESTTKALRAQANGYPGLRWLWMLRRLPEATFEGDYLTTLGYDSTLAEVIGGQASGRSRVQRLGDQRGYPLDQTVVKRLARYCRSVRWLSDLHRDYRWAGKGTNFEFRIGEIPKRLPDEALRASVYLYDERVEQGGGLGRMGTEVFGPTRADVDLREVLRTLDEDRDSMILRLVPIRPSVEAPVPLVGANVFDDDVPTALVRARCMFMSLPLANLAALIRAAPASGPPVLDARAAALLLLLYASTSLVVSHQAGFLSVYATGYLVSDEAGFRVRLGEAFTNTPQPITQILVDAGVQSADAAIALLESMTGMPWPLEAGPIIYRDEEMFAVDLLAAGRRLADSIVYPRVQGPLANVRSEHFEHRVQAAVDRSRHAPPPAIRALRGRTLRLGGLDVTDLDAVARVDGSLVLISCKSVIYSPEYDVGEHRAVRNAATTARNGLADWNDVLATIRASPRGDNYDFSGWSLHGVVCTSGVVWTELGPCTEFVLDGLRAVVSLPELQEWLGLP